jgi:hypothetical protein
MPIERDFSKILAMSDPDLFQWRAEVRRILSCRDDGQLSVLYEGSTDELVNRAREAWSVVAAHSTLY